MEIIYIIFILLIFYTIFSNVYEINTDKIPPELFVAATAFSSVFIGFILIYAMQRYDSNQNNYESFLRDIYSLRKISPSNIKNIDNFLNYYEKYQPDFDVIELEESILSDIKNDIKYKRVDSIINSSINLYNIRISRKDSIPMIVWGILFLILILVSLLMITDKRIPLIVSCLILIVIWSPSLVVYYFYTMRGNKPKKIK